MKRWVRSARDRRAETGVGTLIIFIAMVLVAALAASFLINMVDSLQEHAGSVADDSQNYFNTRMSIVSIEPQSEDLNYTGLYISAQPVKHSNPINSLNVIVIIDDRHYYFNEALENEIEVDEEHYRHTYNMTWHQSSHQGPYIHNNQTIIMELDNRSVPEILNEKIGEKIKIRIVLQNGLETEKVYKVPPIDFSFVNSITIQEQPDVLVYTHGETLSLEGLIVNLSWSNGSFSEVPFNEFDTSNLQADPADGTVLTTSFNNTAIKVTYGEFINTLTDDITIIPVVTSIVVKEQPDTLEYNHSDPLSLDGLVVTLQYTDGSNHDVAYADFLAKGLVADPDAGDEMLSMAHNGSAITVSYVDDSGINAETNELIIIPVVSSIVIKEQPDIMEYNEGELLSLAGLLVTLEWSDGTTSDVSFAEFIDNDLTADPPDGTEMTSVFDNTAITVTYNGIITTETDEITVSP